MLPTTTDIVTQQDIDSTCFTKGYAKNFKGSGPLFLPTGLAPSKVLRTTQLLTQFLFITVLLYAPVVFSNYFLPKFQDEISNCDSKTLCDQGLRFFTPRTRQALILATQWLIGQYSDHYRGNCQSPLLSK